MISTPRPHYLLFTDTRIKGQVTSGDCPSLTGSWQFVLESVDGENRLTAMDTETGITESRLNLLSVIRGLEALDQPSRVTLVTSSRYISHGFRHGINSWRDADWNWEFFGRRVLVENHDLWQRVDVARKIHDVVCKSLHVSNSDVPTANELLTEPQPPQEELQAVSTQNQAEMTMIYQRRQQASPLGRRRVVASLRGRDYATESNKRIGAVA